jgi:hypothetical protein
MVINAEGTTELPTLEITGGKSASGRQWDVGKAKRMRMTF